MFQSVYYIIYMFQCFETPEYGVWNFHLFMFQFVSKLFETIKIFDLDIFSLFQYVSVSLLYNLYVSMFRNTRIWGLEFSPFYVSVRSKRFETIRILDLDIFSLFQYVSVSLLYSIYMFQCFETPEYGVWNFHLFMFQFVSKRFATIRILDLDIFSLFR